MPLRVFDIFCCAFLMPFDIKNCSVSVIISNHNLRYLPPTGGIGINHPICVDTRNIESFVGCFEKHIICINIMRIRIGHHQQMPVSGKLPAKTRQSDLTFLIKTLFRITCKCRGLRQWSIRWINIIERWGAYTTPYRGEIAASNLHMLKQFAIAKYCRLVTNQWMNRLSKGISPARTSWLW